MKRPREIVEGVYQVGGPDLTDSSDCMVYLVTGDPCILIDAGAGPSAPEILALMEKAGCRPGERMYLILTHCHVDHIGGVSFLRSRLPGLKLVAHRGDVPAMEGGDPIKTAAHWYGVDLPPLTIDHVFEGEGEIVEASPSPITLVHTPGHTPGSCVVLTERERKKILFGQDIHGPFMPEFGSDLGQWRDSMEKLLRLEADILCEGHYGIVKGKEAVHRFICHHLSLQGF